MFCCIWSNLQRCVRFLVSVGIRGTLLLSAGNVTLELESNFFFFDSYEHCDLYLLLPEFFKSFMVKHPLIEEIFSLEEAYKTLLRTFPLFSFCAEGQRESDCIKHNTMFNVSKESTGGGRKKKMHALFENNVR